MSETNDAATSAETSDVFNGETPSLEEFNQYRQSGEVPARFTTGKADPGTASDSSEGKSPENDPASDTGRQQERKNRTASERIATLNSQIETLWEADEPDTVKIAQLTSTVDKIERGAGMKRKTEVAPVAEQPKTDQVQQPSRAKPKPDDTDSKGNPKYQTYEDFTEDLADWKADEKINERFAQRDQQRQQSEQSAKLLASIEEGKEIYGEDFGELADATAGAIGQDASVPLLVKQRIGRSDILPHLTYVLGEDPKELAKFLALSKSDPFAALDHIALVEHGIREELSKTTAERDADGKFVSKEPPVKPKTNAPKPPQPVMGSSSGAFDVSDESLSAEEWSRKRTADLAAKRK